MATNYKLCLLPYTKLHALFSWQVSMLAFCDGGTSALPFLLAVMTLQCLFSCHSYWPVPSLCGVCFLAIPTGQCHQSVVFVFLPFLLTSATTQWCLFSCHSYTMPPLCGLCLVSIPMPCHHWHCVVFVLLPMPTVYGACFVDNLQLREYRRERRISNDKLEEESEEIKKIKKVREDNQQWQW